MRKLLPDRSSARAPAGDVVRLPRFDSVAINHMDSLYAYANWLTGNSEESSALLREAYGEACRAGADDPDDQKILVRLFQILRTKFLGFRKGKPAGVQLSPDASGGASAGWEHTYSGNSADPLTEPVVSFLEGLIRRSIRSMPEEYGSAILLCEIENFSYFDIADIMNCAVDEARRRVNEGQRWLRRELTKYSRILSEEPSLSSSPSFS
jgi:RNA polymerase sigma-70 factor (ECF subfamily)